MHAVLTQMVYLKYRAMATPLRTAPFVKFRAWVDVTTTHRVRNDIETTFRVRNNIQTTHRAQVDLP